MPEKRKLHEKAQKQGSRGGGGTTVRSSGVAGLRSLRRDGMGTETERAPARPVCSPSLCMPPRLMKSQPLDALALPGFFLLNLF